MARRAFRTGAAAIMARRKTTWIGFTPTDFTMGAASTGVLCFTLNAAALALQPFTIVRSRFELALRSDQAGGVEIQRAGFGIAVVTDQAVAVGVTACPTPITDLASAKWLALDLIYADENKVIDHGSPATYKTVDSKAMRKVELGSDIAVLCESWAGSSQGMVMTIGGRMLVKNN